MKRTQFQELAAEVFAEDFKYDSAIGNTESYPLHGIGIAAERTQRGIHLGNQIMVTKAGAAYFLRYQCLCFDGSIDTVELQDLKYLFIQFVQVI